MPIKQTLSMRPSRAAKEEKPLRNRLLLSIPEIERATVSEEMEFIALPRHRCLHEPHQPVEYLYFPNEGVISLVVALKDGKTVEAGLVGNEGLTGMSAILGLDRSPLREVVQIAGDAYRIRVGRFKELLPSLPHLQATVNRYAAGLAMQVAQTAACNRLHNIEHRLARWLLMAQDRVESELLPITHDFLATMLGTDRPSVSLAAGVLQKSQMINYRRGSLRVVNRKKLEKFTCECYAIVQQYAGGAEDISGGSTT
jgi:CRP-like cAMP-binding protein